LFRANILLTIILPALELRSVPFVSAVLVLIVLCANPSGSLLRLFSSQGFILAVFFPIHHHTCVHIFVAQFRTAG